MPSPNPTFTPTATRKNGVTFSMLANGAILTMADLYQPGNTDPSNSSEFMTVGGCLDWLAAVDQYVFGNASGQLASQTGSSGATLVGVSAITSTLSPLDASNDLAAGTVQQVFQAIANGRPSAVFLASQVAGKGASTVGYPGVSSATWGVVVPPGTVAHMLDLIIANVPLMTATGASSGQIPIPAPIQAYSNCTECGVPVASSFGQWGPDGQGNGAFIDSGSGGSLLTIGITAPHGSLINAVNLNVKGATGTKPSGGGSLSFIIVSYDSTTDTATTIAGPFVDAAPNGTGAGDYGAVHGLSSGAISPPLTVNRLGGTQLKVVLTGEHGTGANTNARYLGMSRATAPVAVGSPS